MKPRDPSNASEDHAHPAYTNHAAHEADAADLETAPQIQQSSNAAGRLARLLLVVGMAAAAAFGLTKAYFAWQDSCANPALTQCAFQMVDRPAPILAAFPAELQQPLQAWLVLAGREHWLGAGQVALPSGSRFQIKLQSAQGGYLMVHTINPQGALSAQPLWSGSVQPGQITTTGVMRLQGERGQETLLLQLMATPGGVPLAQSRFMLWHM